MALLCRLHPSIEASSFRRVEAAGCKAELPSEQQKKNKDPGWLLRVYVGDVVYVGYMLLMDPGCLLLV